MSKLIAARDFQLKPQHMEHREGASMTQPDEALSIRDILTRFTRGLVDESIYRPGTYQPEDRVSFDDLDLMKVKDMDLVDKDLVREALKVDAAEKQAILDLEASERKLEEDAAVEKQRILDEVVQDRKSAAGKSGEPNAKDKKETKRSGGDAAE